jgi:hypothetical protein
MSSVHPIHRSRTRPLHPGLAQAGFSITEVMVAGVIGAVIITSVAGLNNLSNTSLNSSSQQQVIETAVNRDVETIRQRMVSYTWCSGAGTLEPIADTTRCRQPLSQKSNSQYYFPGKSVSDSPGTLSDKDKFLAACQDNQNTSSNALLARLITAITAPELPQPQGATRSVAVIDGSAKRVQISYAGLNPPRSILMTPTVASWCP